MSLFLDDPVVVRLVLFLLGVFLLYSCFAIGSFITPRVSNNYWNMANSIFVGLIFISVCTASWITGFNSQLTPLILLLAFLFYFKKQDKSASDKRGLLLLPVYYFLPFIYACVVLVYRDHEVIAFMNKDGAYYAQVSYNLISRQTETNLIFNIYENISHPLYHYVELWFNGSISYVFGTNSFLTFCLVYTPIILTIVGLYLIGFIKALKINKRYGFWILFIPVLTALPPFISFFDPPWFVDLHFMSKSMIHYVGVYPVVCFLVMCFCMIWMKRDYLGMLLFSFTGIINPLFLGVVPICLLVYLTVHLLFNKKENSLMEKSPLSHIYIPLLLSIAIAIYAFIISNINLSYPYSEMGFPERSYLVEFVEFSKLLSSTLLYCAVYIFGFYLGFKHLKEQRPLIVFLFAFTLSCFLFFGYYYDIIAGDIIQLQYISWNVPVIFFGTVFLVQGINTFKSKKRALLILLLFLNTSWGMISTFGEKYSSLGGIYSWNGNGTTYHIQDIKKLDMLASEIGYNGAYLVDRNDSFSRGITQSDIIELSCFIPEINTIRLNTVLHDQVDLGCRRIISNTQYEKYHLKDDNDRRQVLYIIAKNNIDWIFVQEPRFIFPFFLRQKFPVEHHFRGFKIFSR